MELASWMVVAPLAFAMSAFSLGPTAGGPRAGEPPPDPRPCTAQGAAPPGIAWYRLDPVLDRSGTLAGRRLTTGIGTTSAPAAQLAPESFASGPVAGMVLTGEDDGTVSRLRVVDPATGCAMLVGEERDVIRSAVVAPAADRLYEHRVDRETRRDLGIWRRDVGGGTTRLLDGLEPDPVFGPTFVTDLLLEPDGRLVVSSCAQSACRIRVLDPQHGSVARVRGTGPALGMAGGTLVAREACAGQPCPIDAIDLATGRRHRLVRDAFAAALVGPVHGTLAVEVAAGRVQLLDVQTGRRVGRLTAAGVPMAGGSTASSGAQAPDGLLVLAVGGRPGTRPLAMVPLAGSRPSSRLKVSR